MKSQRKLKNNAWKFLPYSYFIGLAAFWFFEEIFAIQNISYIALGFMLILLAQAIIQNKTFGVSLGIFAIAVSSVSFLAVLSEFCEFKVISDSAIQLIGVGSMLSLSGLAMGVMMIASNGRKLST